MKKAILHINDQVNAKFEGLDAHIRRKMSTELKLFVPYARHTPAYKLGRWDGTISYCSVGGGTYINLLDKVLPMVIDDGYEIEIHDHRPEYNFKFPEFGKDFFSHIKWPKGHPSEGEPVEFRDYQVDAIRRYMSEHQSLQSISTGAGKTVITAALAKLAEPYGRTICIVPSKSLVVQTEEDYLLCELDTGVYFGDRKDIGKTHTICTWQSLATLAKKTRRDEADLTIEDFLEDVVCVIVDEVHGAKANDLRDLLGGPLAHVPLRWGMTGTIPKENFDFWALLGCIGPVVGEVKASELQKKDVLANCHVDIIQTDDSNYEFSTFPEESKYLTTNKDRVEWMSDYCKKISESGNTLILVNRVETGKLMNELIEGSSFIYGNVKLDDRNEQYKEIHTSDNKIIIATYGVAAVGINIPRIFNLVLLEPGKSFVRVIQSIGRGIRKAKDKDFVQIYDICSNLKFSKRHLSKRRAFYKEAEYPDKVFKVKYTDK